MSIFSLFCHRGNTCAFSYCMRVRTHLYARLLCITINFHSELSRPTKRHTHYTHDIHTSSPDVFIHFIFIKLILELDFQISIQLTLSLILFFIFHDKICQYLNNYSLGHQVKSSESNRKKIFALVQLFYEL